MNNIISKKFWEKERERAVYTIEKIHKNKWDILPSEYKENPDRAVKHFLEEIRIADEKIKQLSLEN